MTVHILNQFLWPDAAPTAVYAEQLACCLQQNGFEVKLIGGGGSYRKGVRPEPLVPRRILQSYTGQRGGFISSLREYRSIFLAFQSYIRSEIEEGDIVICTSAPPQSIHLIKAIKERKARGIYWLQDYYPELLRGFINYPRVVYKRLSSHWNHMLNQWNQVVKISPNLDYHAENAQVSRNWPTLHLGQPQPVKPLTASYFGNFGYGHCHKLFVETCEDLRAQGYSITLVGDGPKISRLPSWIKVTPATSETGLIEKLWQSEIHLIAADPKITGAVFPSKYWNSRATGRKIVASGFAGPMLDELNASTALVQLPGPGDWLPLIKNR